MKTEPKLVIYPIEQSSEVRVQMIEEAKVHAGFPSPVQDAYISQPIDLNKELVKHPASTFIVKVIGISMIDEGIDDGDMLVVDRSLFPTERSIAVCVVEGEFALKRIIQREGRVVLMSGNKDYPPIIIDDPSELQVWGVVQWVLKKK
ncbi:MAG: translesion error-prone DNA polymerase V autoproteolytic subunit [Prevotellaceae bacterium]|nr:translesion error-prone DNA polymerase V autoproteolytic subunit [Prevotellaceae bacterium]